jgi:hypothetical protein
MNNFETGLNIMRDEKKLHPDELYYMIKEETGMKLISKSFVIQKYRKLCLTRNFTKDGACTIISNTHKIDFNVVKEVCDASDKELSFPYSS